MLESGLEKSSDILIIFKRMLSVMGLFFSSKKYRLTLADFKPEVSESSVTQTWMSPEFRNLLPQPPKDIPQKTTIQVTSMKASIALFDEKVEVIFDPDDIDDDQEDFIAQINSQLNWIAKNRDKIEKAIAAQLLDLKNKKWLKEGESPFTPKVFLQQIVLASVEFFDDAAFELSYSDGQIFGGHSIYLPITAEREIEIATIEG